MPVAAPVVEDLAFDARLPLALQRESPSHFTPVAVARHAAALLVPEGGEIVLDVGAGPGKFCLVAAHACRTASFLGVELREGMVATAKRLAAEWKLSNVRFVHGNAFDVDWSPFDGFYFFNPFSEHLFDRAFAIDHTIELDQAHFDTYVAATLDRLAAAREGTRVVTYHGLGAEMPAGYELDRVDLLGSDRVELWIQTRQRWTRPFRRVERQE